MLTVVALCIGASTGALLRWQLGVWFNTGAVIPWGTLAANWLGAYAVGFVVVWFQHHAGLDPVWRLAIITGLLGALTTFSTFSIETVHLLQQGRLAWATLNTSLHVLGSLALTALGLWSANRALT